MELAEVTQAILKALEGLKGIERVESDNSSIFFSAGRKNYFITLREHVPPPISVRTFNPQPKPLKKK
jgi:hypothetical protein